MHVAEEYIVLTRLVAERFAKEGFGVVYGGTAYGMMKELAQVYKSHGGKHLVGVMAEDLIQVTKGYEAFSDLDDKYLEPNMEMRKYRIAKLSDAFLVLPGGYGSFEEFGSFMGGNINKLYSKPVVLFNYNHFYDTLVDFFEELVEKRFSKIGLREAVYVTEDMEEVVKYFKNYHQKDLVDKFV